MICYHGSTMEIRKPDVGYSKRFLDFGPGMYFTTYQHQAETWAKRKALRTGEKAIVNVYELIEDFSDYRALRFYKEDEAWLEYVCDCRRGENIYQNYDIVFGSVANDKVFRVVDFYFRGVWDKERVLKELKYYKLNDQICILNQELINQGVIFKKSYEVK